MGVLERIDTICRRHADERELRVAVLAELRSAVQFDAFAWLLTDPMTCVGSSPVAEVPVISDLPRVIRAKYLSTVNRWTSLAPGVAATLIGSSGTDRSGSDPWRSMLSAYGICDVASVVLSDPAGCWGFIDLWRRSTSFDPDETDLLGTVAGRVIPALRRAQLSTFEMPSPLDGTTIAVSIERTPPAERASLYGRIAGLTARETDVLDSVVAGHDTRHAAHNLAISEHTLQDHLKSIFAKTRTDSRRLLIARATGATT